MSIGTYTEFQPLQEVLVGSAFDQNNFDHLEDVESRDVFKRIFEETNEDLETLVDIFKQAGVKVHRPKSVFKFSEHESVSTPWMKSYFPNHPLMPRDIMGVYGSTIVEQFTGDAGRFFENLAYQHVSRSLFDRGMRWVSMPMPYVTTDKIPYNQMNNSQLLYHAANIVKCGKDLFYSQPGDVDQVKGKGTSVGLNWLKKELGDEFRFNEIYTGGHADGKVALLKPGVVMTWKKRWMPDKLKNWDIIEVESEKELPDEFQALQKQRYYKNFIQEWFSHWIGCVEETVFDVNVFSIDESTVICTGTNKEAFARMEKHGITPVYWKFRHQYFWDGGIHCVTQDLVRKGQQEDYFG
jgi:N-dimethylarginine dimethylaminohydrolase